MKKPMNNIRTYFKSDAASRTNQLQPPREESIYKNALKRKYAQNTEQTHDNETILFLPARAHDEKDEIINRQCLEINQLQEKCRKLESTQSRSLKIIHQYRHKLLRMENSRAQKENYSDIAPLQLPPEDEITKNQTEFFSEQELVQLNSINKYKRNDRAYGRQLLEFLYRVI